MSTIGQRIKQKRTEAPKISQAKLGKMCGVSGVAVTYRERDEIEPTAKLISKIAKALNVSVEWLLTGGEDFETNLHTSTIDNDVTRHQNVTHISLSDTRKVPMANWSNADNYSKGLSESKKANEYIPIDGLECSSETFALRVDGDSMQPEFNHGVIIIVDPERAVKPGDFVIAKYDGDNEATFKKYVKDGSGFSLMPLNQMYDKIQVTERTKILGVVIEQQARKSY